LTEGFLVDLVEELKPVLRKHLGGRGVLVATIVRSIDENHFETTPLITLPIGLKVSLAALMRSVQEGQERVLNNLREELYATCIEKGVSPKDVPQELTPRTRKDAVGNRRVLAYVS
jgi:hypothetical protein